MYQQTSMYSPYWSLIGFVCTAHIGRQGSSYRSIPLGMSGILPFRQGTGIGDTYRSIDTSQRTMCRSVSTYHTDGWSVYWYGLITRTMLGGMSWYGKPCNQLPFWTFERLASLN